MRSTERELVDVFEHASAGLAIGTPEGIIVRVNPALCALLGRSPDELVGADLRDFTHPDDVPLTDQVRGEDRPAPYEKRYVRPDGSVVWALVGGEVVHDETGEPMHLVGSIVDITARHRAEEEVARRAAQQAAVVELSRQALTGTDVDELLDLGVDAVMAHLQASKASVLELLPGDCELLLRRGIGWTGGIVNELRLDANATQAGYALRVDAPVVTIDIDEEDRYPTASALREQGVTSSASAVLRVDGQPWGVLGAHFQDRTAISADDVVFLQAVADVLGAAIARRRHEEIAERARQQDRLALVGQLAAGLAHDFSNVLTVVKLHAELLSLNSSLDDAGRRQSSVIAEQADRAITLVWQLLDAANPGDIALVDLDLRAFFDDLVPVVRRTLPRDVELWLEGADSEVIVRADRARLNQVALNLIANAADAMPTGGRITVRVAMDDTSVDPGAVFEVIDDGVGMPPEIAARAFEPFFSTKGPGRGTGLGLSQVDSVVARHGGRVELRSAPASGTVVRVWLPLAPLHPPADAGVHRTAEQAEADVVPRADGDLVLLVEDDLAVAAAVRAMAEDLGYAVVSAANGREALDVLHDTPDIAVVFSDVSMPVMDGAVLARHLAANRPELPLILTSAQRPSEGVLRRPLVSWLQKPYSRQRFAELLAAAVQRGER